MADEQEILNRWRLVLGKYAAEQISFSQGSQNFMEMEQALDYLYGREYGEDQDIREERQGIPSLQSLTGSQRSKSCFPNRLWKLWSAMRWKNTK